MQLSGSATAGTVVQQYTIHAAQNSTISPTAHHISFDFSLTTPTGPSTDGVVMWYHALKPENPGNDAPFQLTEVTFRSDYYDPTKTPTGFQFLLGTAPGTGISANDFNLADYDISFVDTMFLPVAMEAPSVPIPNSPNVTPPPYGWVNPCKLSKTCKTQSRRSRTATTSWERTLARMDIRSTSARMPTT